MLQLSCFGPPSVRVCHGQRVLVVSLQLLLMLPDSQLIQLAWSERKLLQEIVTVISITRDTLSVKVEVRDLGGHIDTMRPRDVAQITNSERHAHHLDRILMHGLC